MQDPSSHTDLAADTCDGTATQLDPSTTIDAALCDLLQSVMHFSDDDFDSEWFDLSDTEVEGLVVQLLQHLTGTLNGKQLSGCLLMLRTEAAPEDPLD